MCHVACVAVVIRLQSRRSQVLVTAGVRDFSVLETAWTDSGTHPASYSQAARDTSPRLKWPGCEVDHSLRFKAEAKDRVLPLFPFYAFVVCTGRRHILTCYTHYGGNRKLCFGISSLCQPSTDS